MSGKAARVYFPSFRENDSLALGPLSSSMKAMKTLRRSIFLVALVVVGSLLMIMTNRSMTASAQPQPPKAQPSPVEKDMHEFMEYVFQPTYKRLQQAMATEPADNDAWKCIKADSLMLAEGGNLLLHRSPEKEAAAWNDLSAAVRESGSSLYQASKKKDYKSARQHYEAMLKNCNACHDKFADGEHQLSP